MTEQTIGIGLVGVQPGRSWAAIAHVPALKALHDDFRIVGVANTSAASAQKAVDELGIGQAFEDLDAMIASPEVDAVSVTVKVPHHREIVAKALRAGKHVYCEWPLGNGLQEAIELADIARDAGVVAVAGTQARVSPALLHLRSLIGNGYVGEVLATSIVGTGGNWGPTVEPANAYTLDAANGATMLTIPVGHLLAAVADVLGPFASVSASLDTLRTSSRETGSGAVVPMTAPDQVLVTGHLASGAPISIHYHGGRPRGLGLTWHISGTEGDILVTGANGHAQMVELSLEGAHGQEDALRTIELPAAQEVISNLGTLEGNVARMYCLMAADLRLGTRTAPSFDDAVETHRLIAAIERSAREGRVIRLPDR